MSYALEPALVRDLTEAKAALARHGIVIIRAVETDLEPAIMAEVRDSLASSPKKLAQIKEDDLDDFVERVRKAAMKSADELRALYTRLLAKLGTEQVDELVKELEGIDQLFKWERVAKTVDPVNKLLAAKGFKPIELEGPGDLSDAFDLEFQVRWNAAFARFKMLADQAAEEIKRQESEESEGTVRTKTQRKR